MHPRPMSALGLDLELELQRTASRVRVWYVEPLLDVDKNDLSPVAL